MISEPCFAFIIEKNDIESKFNHLFDYKLNREVFPDRYVAMWKYISNPASKSDFISLLSKNKSKKHFESMGILFGGDLNLNPLPGNFIDQVLTLHLESDVQGIFGNRDEHLFLFIQFSNSEFTYQKNNFQSVFVIQKLIEILNPIYGWIIHSSIVKNTPIDTKNLENTQQKPWLYYSPTRFFSNKLLFDLKISDSLWLEKIDQIYRLDFLTNGVWLANCHGLGNEVPYLNYFPRRLPNTPEEKEFVKNSVGDLNMQGNSDFWDKNLERIIKLQSNKHDTLMSELFGEIRL